MYFLYLSYGIPVNTVEIVYSSNRDIRTQKSLYPFCCSAGYPCSGILERYLLCERFSAACAAVSVSGHTHALLYVMPDGSIFQIDVVLNNLGVAKYYGLGINGHSGERLSA